MAKRKTTETDIGHPDYLPAQLINGATDEERDAEVALRIRDTMIKMMNAMGNVPEIAEGDVIPDVDLMLEHYDTLGILVQKLQQRLERLKPPPKASEKRGSKKRTSRTTANVPNGFD